MPTPHLPKIHGCAAGIHWVSKSSISSWSRRCSLRRRARADKEIEVCVMSNQFQKAGVAGSLALAVCAVGLCADLASSRSETDTRIRVMAYSGDKVYRLVGYVGYQIDLEFEPEETFVGLGAGDIEGVSFAAEGNHLFLKPKAAKVSTNLTVLTTRREYQFDYTASTEHPDERQP